MVWEPSNTDALGTDCVFIFALYLLYFNTILRSITDDHTGARVIGRQESDVEKFLIEPTTKLYCTKTPLENIMKWPVKHAAFYAEFPRQVKKKKKNVFHPLRKI